MGVFCCGVLLMFVTSISRFSLRVVVGGFCGLVLISAGGCFDVVSLAWFCVVGLAGGWC